MSDASDRLPEVDSDSTQGNSDNPELSDGSGTDDGAASASGSASSEGQNEGNEADSDGSVSAEDTPAPSSTTENRKRAADGDAGNSAKKAKATPPPPIMEIRNCSLSAPTGSAGGGIIIANCPVSCCAISGAQISGCKVSSCSVSRAQVSNCSISCCSVSGQEVDNCNITCSSVSAAQLNNCTYSLSSISGSCRQTNGVSGLNSTNFGTSSLFMINGHSFRGSTGNFNGFQNSAIQTGLVTIPSNEPWNVQIQRDTIGNDLKLVLGPTTVTITPRAGMSPSDFAAYRNHQGHMEIDWESPGRHARPATATSTQARNGSCSFINVGTTTVSNSFNGHRIQLCASGWRGLQISKYNNGRVTIPSSEPLNSPLQITINGNILTAVLGGVTITVTPRAGISANDLVVYRNDRGEINVELP